MYRFLSQRFSHIHCRIPVSKHRHSMQTPQALSSVIYNRACHHSFSFTVCRSNSKSLKLSTWKVTIVFLCKWIVAEPIRYRITGNQAITQRIIVTYTGIMRSLIVDVWVYHISGTLYTVTISPDQIDNIWSEDSP